MQILFWNINKTTTADLLEALCRARHIDILFLAENEISDQELLPRLNISTAREYQRLTFPQTRICCYSALPESFVEEAFSGYWMCIAHIKSPDIEPFLLGAVHFPSKMYKNEKQQGMLMTTQRADIDRMEDKYDHTRTLLLGDFNQNPFELGMTDPYGLHAVMSRKIAEKGEHRVDRSDKKYFYNPMWSRMGDESVGPEGTYFHGSCENHYYWNTFDQVLIRPDLLASIPTNNVEVITEIDGKDLLRKSGRINNNISDHLPILVTIN